jgi:hypothetical protein
MYTIYIPVHLVTIIFSYVIQQTNGTEEIWKGHKQNCCSIVQIINHVHTSPALHRQLNLHNHLIAFTNHDEQLIKPTICNGLMAIPSFLYSFCLNRVGVGVAGPLVHLLDDPLPALASSPPPIHQHRQSSLRAVRRRLGRAQTRSRRRRRFASRRRHLEAWVSGDASRRRRRSCGGAVGRLSKSDGRLGVRL